MQAIGSEAQEFDPKIFIERQLLETSAELRKGKFSNVLYGTLKGRAEERKVAVKIPSKYKISS